ncbi:MAG: hypothetical protein MUF83_18525 [Acidimicrobiales bacterium]|nr:hypothetical protein [Acidimicrobiales bacterium]
MTDISGDDPVGGRTPARIRAPRRARTGTLWSRPQRLRLFSSAAHRSRTRRATDVLLLALGAAGVALLVTTADPPTAFETALTDLAQLLVTSVLLGGLDETMAIAQERMGAEGIATLVPCLQVPALGRSLRQDGRRARRPDCPTTHFADR